MARDTSEKPSSGSGQTPDAKGAGTEKEDWIGAHLRKVYDEALSEPVPERFLYLLKQIEKKERGS